MRRVLFHSYHFPPTGGSGAQRPARMVRYLPELGYEPVVVTAPGPGEERWTPADATLGSDVPADTVVHRVPGPEPAASAGWRHRAERWLRVKDGWSRSWIESSTRLGIETAREADVDLLYAWTQPYVSAEAVAEIARVVGKPWVADLGDPWALDEMMIYPTGLHRRLELRLMRRVLSSASALVMSTPEAARRVRVAFPELADRTIVAIPNGFEAGEFTRSTGTERADDDVFRIVHTGYLHTDLGLRQHRTALLRKVLGGAVPGVDILGRSHVYLIEAVERVRREHPEIGARLEVQFAGVMSPDDIAIAQRSPASKLLGFVSHDDALGLLARADLLFLPMHHLPAGTRATVVPGKTYEYIASGRPILAAVPEGDARDLLDAAGTAYLCGPKDVDAIANAIVTAFRRRRAGQQTAPPPPSLLRDYDYRSLARALASVFDQVAAGSRPRRSAAA
jgi:glycosyltransferase involved in cell wall biosynthesis